MARQTKSDARDWLRLGLESLGDAVVTTDGAGRITYLNPAAERLTGAGAESARGKLLNQVLRLVLWGLLGSLLAYNYYALSLPGSGSLDVLGSWAGLLTTIVGGLVALFAAYRLEGAA